MKQNPFQYLSKQFSSLHPDEGLRVLGFHPSFFPGLIELLRAPIAIKLPEHGIEHVYKHLSGFWMDDSVVFLASVSNGASPAGFASGLHLLSGRAGVRLSNNDGVRAVFYTEGGANKKVINKKASASINIDSDIAFEDVGAFLCQESYARVEQVSSSGEYCLRGGIIDVYPKYSSRPVRIDFFETPPVVSAFDVSTQITTNLIKNYTLLSSRGSGLASLKDVGFDKYICAEYDGGALFVCGDCGVRKDIILRSISLFDYQKKYESGDFNLFSLPSLSSVGLYLKNFSVCVPSWFIGAATSKKRTHKEAFQLNIAEIKKGDYLVHRHHGVGVCGGLAQSTDTTKPSESLVIKYADGGSVFVEVGNLGLVSFYSKRGSGGVVLDSLSKKGVWLRKKLSAKKRAEDVVGGLLQSYVSRQGVDRAPSQSEPDLEAEFINNFPYDETPDQASAWKSIASDLCSKKPMDRLLCGDVGFGKTELAIRAAFRVILSGRRVLVLAPTTILANQLFSSFKSRLGPFAIEVDVVSRLSSSPKKNIIKKNILNNNNDLVVGTHAILNDNIYAKGLGLLIVDEEHRFGVKQKEKIRVYKEGVDVLSMSATPIPRSINLALSGIFAISMLQTPPLLRKPIYTSVNYFSKKEIVSALRFEFERGGQSYFVHNDIKTIGSICSMLQNILPNQNIDLIHGQEKSNDIELKMSLFVSKQIDVLVCTSIIESGIDISSANTIIINNAHLFGLSQLYQMRGRVGRGALQAFAYLLIPKNVVLSRPAHKRIKTIKENTSLGSGYNVAQSDMEIRGVGSLFGYRQSGGAGSVGYELYTKMVEEVLEKNNSDETKEGVSSFVEMRFFSNRLIDEKYISNESVRFSIYKALSSVKDVKELSGVLNNIQNRFGPAPESLKNLIKESELKLKLRNSIISSIIRRGCGVVVGLYNFDGALSVNGFLKILNDYWTPIKIKYHFIPSKDKVFVVCFHLSEGEDSFSSLATFVDKFIYQKI